MKTLLNLLATLLFITFTNGNVETIKTGSDLGSEEGLIIEKDITTEIPRKKPFEGIMKLMQTMQGKPSEIMALINQSRANEGGEGLFKGSPRMGKIPRMQRQAGDDDENAIRNAADALRIHLLTRMLPNNEKDKFEDLKVMTSNTLYEDEDGNVIVLQLVRKNDEKRTYGFKIQCLIPLQTEMISQWMKSIQGRVRPNSRQQEKS